jgi:hypothetical protein
MMLIKFAHNNLKIKRLRLFWPQGVRKEEEKAVGEEGEGRENKKN